MDKIVRSIVSAVITQALGPTDIDPRRALTTGELLCHKIGRLSADLHLPLYVFSILLDFSGIFFGGRRFSNLTSGQQQKMMTALQTCFVGPISDALKFYQKLSLHIYYSLPGEARNDRP
jgi:hypothetical protein